MLLQHPKKESFMLMKNELWIAGKHVLADFWGAQHLTNLDFAIDTLKRAAAASHVTILEAWGQSFDVTDGFTAVVTLAESHMSLHSWPEKNLLVIDIFFCGHADPQVALNELAKAFQPSNITVSKHDRGVSYEHVY